MTKNYQDREKFFYAPSSLFPDWPYKSRLAIGMRFSDFKAINAPELHFRIKGKCYSIETKKALELGNKYVLHLGKLPNLIPKEEWKEELIEEIKETKEANKDKQSNGQDRRPLANQAQGGTGPEVSDLWRV